MEDQGIMALPAGGMQAPTTAPMGSPRAEAAIAAFDQARNQMDPKEFGDDLLSSAEQADPAAVQQFRQALDRMSLPPEIIDALGQMVDIILSEPENYQEMRAEFIKEGVPEDILPEQFDALYFSAMNLALDQLDAKNASQPMPQGFADGGIATLNPIPAGLASMGRGTDTMLAHITPSEARMLRRFGGSGTINPTTGLPEYGFFDKVTKPFKSAAKSIGNAVKSVGKVVVNGVKSVVSEVKRFASSSVGRVVTAVALGFFLGPAAASMMGISSAAGVAAISGFVGSAGTTLLGGGNIKQALKAGAVGGLTAGAMAGATGGMNAFEAGSYTGPTTVAGQVDRFTQGLDSLLGTSAPPTAPTSELSASTLDYTGTGDVIPGQAPSVAPPTVPTPSAEAFPVSGAEPFNYQPAFGEGVQYAGSPVPTSQFGQAASPFEQGFYNQGQSFNEAIGLGPDYAAQPFAASPSNVMIEREMLGMTGPIDTARQFATSPIDTSVDFFNRNISPAGRQAQGAIQAQNAADIARQNYIDQALPRAQALNPSGQIPAQVQAQIMSGADAAAAAAAKAATPGLFSAYAPIVATGMGAAYLGGLFDPVQPEAPGIVPRETGFDLIRKNPEEYDFSPGGSRTVYADQGTYGQLPNTQFAPPQFQIRDPRTYLPGGIASLRPQGYAFGGMVGAIAKAVRNNPQIAQAAQGQGGSQPAPSRGGIGGMIARAIQEAQMAKAVQGTPGGQAASQAPAGRGFGAGLVSRLLNSPNIMAAISDKEKEKMSGLAGLAALTPQRFNTGGDIQSMSQKYPRRTGQISGPGTEKSDSIPAMLSDGEFVMTAAAVRGAGGGSRREGAKRMYQMMRQFERKAKNG